MHLTIFSFSALQHVSFNHKRVQTKSNVEEQIESVKACEDSPRGHFLVHKVASIQTVSRTHMHTFLQWVRFLQRFGNRKTCEHMTGFRRLKAPADFRAADCNFLHRLEFQARMCLRTIAGFFGFAISGICRWRISVTDFLLSDACFFQN